MDYNTEVRMKWYIEQRLQFLQNRLDSLRAKLELDIDETTFDYEILREFLETKGRIREIENLLQHIDTW